MHLNKNLHARVLASVLAVVTAASPITTYAAEMQMVESVNLDGEDSITRIETEVGKDEASRFLFIKLNQGGIVVLNKDEENQQTVKLEEIDKKLCINVYDREGTLLSSEDAEENQYTYLYETEADKVVTVNALPAKGFGVADFESVKSDVKEDTGFTDSIADGEEAAESFAYPVLMDDDTVITVRFKEELKEEATDEEVKDAEDGETEGTEEVTDAEDKADAAEDKNDAENTEDKAEGTEKSADATEPTEGEDATETPEGEEDLLIGQPEESDGEDAEVTEGEDDLLIGQPEDTEAPEGEDDLLIEKPENTEGEDDLLIEKPEDAEVPEGEDDLLENAVPEDRFAQIDEAMLDDLAKLNSIDFSSGRLVILTDNPDVIVDPEHQLANYGNIYLMQYKSAEQAMNAYVYYALCANAVEPDMPVKAASQDSISNDADLTQDGNTETTETPIEAPVDTNATEIEVTENANPIATLAETDAFDTLDTGKNVIALIDTGAGESQNVINRISLIDDVLTGNGHGDEMVNAIVSQNPDAQIISIRAIGDDGLGTVSSIIAGMEYAIEQKVDIINLSMYAKTNMMSSVIISEIQKATDMGIIVVGAAGNDGADAAGYIPGSAEAAYIIGAANENGERLKNSNFGNTVDYNVVGTSTSEATALFTGFVSRNGLGAVSGVLNHGMIFATDYTADIDDTLTGEDFKLTLKDESEYRVDTGKSMHLKIKMMNDKLVQEGMTIDSVMLDPTEEARNAVYADVGFDVPIYKSEVPGKYLIFTDEMYKNGLASGKVMDAVFTNANMNGEVLTEGVYFDADYNVAVIDEAIFKDRASEDYADVQLQLMVPVDVDGGVKDIHVSIDNQTDFVDAISSDMHLSGRPLFNQVFQIVSQESADKISAANLTVYLNGSDEPLPKDEFAYNAETGEFAVLENNCLVSDIKIEISPYGISLFGIADTNHTVNDLGRLCYLKADPSKFTVGTYKKYTVEVYQSGFGFTNAPSNTTLWNMGLSYFDHPKYPEGDKSGGDGSMGAWVHFGIPTNAFGVDFQFRKKDMTAYPNWSASKPNVNQPVRGGCHHTKEAWEIENGIKQNMEVLLRVVDKAKSSDGYTEIVFCIETTHTAYDGDYPQTVGSVFKVAVPEAGVKVHKKIGYDTYAKSTPNINLNAEFTIYSDKACTKRVKVLKFDSAKSNDSITYDGLEPNKVYYIKETKPCDGCMPDDTLYKFTTGFGTTTQTSEFINVATNQKIGTINVINNEAYKFSLDLIKEDTKGTKLPGAVFRVQYRSKKKGETGSKLIATWFFKSGDGSGGTKLGEVHYHPNYLLDTWTNPRTGKSYTSDPIITTNGSRYYIPEGWIYIQELMSPNEDKKDDPSLQQYKRDSTTYEFELKGKAENTQNFTNPIVKPPVEKTWENPEIITDDPWKVQVQIKKVNESLKGLEGAKFGVYYDEECTEPVRDNAYIEPDEANKTYIITSGPDGLTEILTIDNIPKDTAEIILYCKELNPPNGYAASEKPYMLKFTNEKFLKWLADGNDPKAYVPELKFFGEAEGEEIVWKNSAGWKVNVNAKKIDKNKKVLAGAVFEVFIGEPEDGVKLDEVLTSGDDGMTNTITIPVPSDQDKIIITCREKTPPVGYVKSDKVYRLEFSKDDFVKPDGQTKTFGIDDLRPAAPDPNETYEGIVNETGWEVKLDAKKVDADGNPLAGAVFGIFDNPECEGEPIDTMTSGEDGVAGPVTIAIPMDKEEYTVFVKEIQAPPGYMIVDDIEPATFIKAEYNGEVFHVFHDGLKNDKAAWELQVNVKKTDGDGNPLAGAVIGLYSDRECTDLIKELTSGEDGMTETFIYGMAGDVDSITIYCKEISAPEGYVPSTEMEEYTFTFDKYKELKEASDDPDNFHGELHTFFPDGLKNGTPTPTPPEVTPPPPPGEGDAHVKKTSAAAEDIIDLETYSLAGAVFHVTAKVYWYKPDTSIDHIEDFQQDITTHEDGISDTINCPNNSFWEEVPPRYDSTTDSYIPQPPIPHSVTTTYTVTEITPPDGHRKNEGSWSFSVTMHPERPPVFSPSSEIQVKDEPLFSDMELIKRDAKGNPIENVVFKAEYFDNMDGSGSPVRTWYLQTDAAGRVKVDETHIATLAKWLGSDPLFTHGGKPVLPIGYLRLTEVDAPAEFVMSDKPVEGPLEAEKMWEPTGFPIDNLDKVNGTDFINDIEPCSIKIHKYEEDGTTPLDGVEFQLTFLTEAFKTSPGKQPWYDRLLTLEEGKDSIVRSTVDGEVIFDNLDQGTYRLVEIKSAPGHTLLKDPIDIIITLPMTMTEEEAENYGNVDFSTGKEDVSYTGKWYFVDISYDVTNGVQFVMPVTGSDGIWKYGIMGMTTAAVIATGIIIMETNKKKRRRPKHNRKKPKSDDDDLI